MLRSRLNDGGSLMNKIHEKLINFYEKWIKFEKLGASLWTLCALGVIMTTVSG